MAQLRKSSQTPRQILLARENSFGLRALASSDFERMPGKLASSISRERLRVRHQGLGDPEPFESHSVPGEATKSQSDSSHRPEAAPSRNSTTSESTRWCITATFDPSGDSWPSKLISADAITRGAEPLSGWIWMLAPPSLRTG